MRSTTFLYDDPDHRDRITGTVESPDWTDDDRALLLALQMYESSLCPGCGYPIDQAWHTHSDGWWETTSYVCYPCTTQAAADSDDGSADDVTYDITRLTLPPDREFPPFELDVTTDSR